MATHTTPTKDEWILDSGASHAMTHNNPPNVATRPSGSSSADEWYTRGTVGVAALDHVSVLGSKICALNTGLSPIFTDVDAPPVSSTVESGRITALT